MKNIVLIILLSIISNLCRSQNLISGLYESKEGSTLEIKEGRFFYNRSSAKVETDIIAIWPEYESFGTYIKKGESLFMTSHKLKLKNNPERGIKFDIKEIDINPSSLRKDTTIISLNYDKDLISVYLCNTLIEQSYNYKDASNCYKLDEINYLKHFSGDYFIRVYPNIDNHVIRTLPKINTISFDSEFEDKEPLTDLEISISFDVNNFSLFFLENEQFLVHKNKIYHNGQEFVLVK